MGVDSSKESTKVEVRDADDGRLVAQGHATHVPARPPRSEQDPGTWWEALVTAIGRSGVVDIAALSVSGQQHALVAVDAAGAVLRPAKLDDDTESAPQAAAMVRRLGAGRWAKACGSVPGSWLTVSKLAWLAEQEPDALARLGTVLLPHDWLTYRLTGRLVTDRGDASGTGYWSPAEERWRGDVLESVVGAPPGNATSWLERLPEVLGPSEPSDWMGASVHELLGLRGRPLCAAGTGHGMAIALGVGLRPGDALVALDRCGMVASVSLSPVSDAKGAIAGFADASRRFLPTVRMGDTAGQFDAFARTLGRDGSGLSQLALQAPAGSGGVVLVPAAEQGDRSALFGLEGDVGREHVARAVFEGVACAALDAIDALVAAGAFGDGRVVVTGAGERSAAFPRVMADVAGRPISHADDGHSAAKGACVQAAAVLHGAEPAAVIEAWSGAGGVGATEVGPSPAANGAAVRARFRQARNSLRHTETS